MIAPDTEDFDGSFYGDAGGRSSSGDRLCYGCGGSDHILKTCPNKKKQGGGSAKPRAPLKVKKFYCALHKDDKTRKCDSNSCIDLRRMKDVQLRVVLLKENKDCTH